MDTVYLVLIVNKDWNESLPNRNVSWIDGAYTSVVSAADHFGRNVEFQKSPECPNPSGVVLISFAGMSFKVMTKYIPTDERKQPSLFD